MRPDRSRRTLATYARGTGWVIALGLAVLLAATVIATTLTWVLT